MRKILSFLFCFLFFINNFIAQDSLWIVQSIQFEGLEKTRPHYLRKFLSLKEGSIFKESDLKNDIQQLWNVGTTQQVSAKIDTISPQNLSITFQLREKKTLLPIVNVGGINDNVWFQLGFIDFNGLGLGHQVLGMYQNNDGRHSGQLFYRIPYLNQRWGAAFNLLQWRSIEPLYFSEGSVTYDYNNTNLGLTLIRNFGFQKRLEFGSSIFRENYKKSASQILDNPPGPDEVTELKFSPKLEYIDNRINYFEFYLEGWAWRGIGQSVFNFKDNTIFNSLILEFRKFYRLGTRGNFAMRGRFGISTNNESPFAPFVVDSRVNLRGSGNRIERGTGQLILNMEYRYTLKDRKNWAWQIVGFSDLGNWRSPGGTINEFFEREELRHFVGGGFRLIYKRMYDAILRVDYGIDIFNTAQHGIVIGIGQYF